MTRTEAKAWAADAIESIAKCVHTHRDLVRTVQVRAARFAQANSVEVTCSEGHWSAVYTPKPNGWLVLNAFVFGNAPAMVLLPFDERGRIEQQFDVSFS